MFREGERFRYPMPEVRGSWFPSPVQWTRTVWCVMSHPSHPSLRFAPFSLKILKQKSSHKDTTHSSQLWLTSGRKQYHLQSSHTTPLSTFPLVLLSASHPHANNLSKLPKSHHQSCATDTTPILSSEPRHLLERPFDRNDLRCQPHHRFRSNSAV